MPVSEDGSAIAPGRENQLLALIPRWRSLFFILIGLMIVSAFNGHWRIGRDSAAYRKLGHQLAVTGKYNFRDKPDAASYSDQQDIRYPGMPFLLARVEKVFGRSDTAAVLAVTLMAIATLVLTYRLVKPIVPLWLATAVVFGMGANGRFLEHANEVLSDVPFLLGVVLSLIAFDRLQRARERRSRALAMSLLVIGLIFSAAMRPTFWVLALALVFTCFWGLFKPIHAREPIDNARPRRLACALTLAVLAIAAAVFVLVDIRGKSGGYENKMRLRLVDFNNKVLDPLPENVYAVLEQTLPEAFFGTQLGPGFIPVGGDRWIGLSAIYSLILIISAVWLVRRNVLWGLFVLFTVLTMATFGSVPRYFIMILPLLLVGWGLHINWLAEQFKTVGAKEAIVFAGLGLVVIPNLISCANLIREQRGISRPQDGFKHVGFAQAYHSGKWQGVEEVARMIHDHVRKDQKIFGPEATVLTFLSDRDVFGLGMLLPKKDRGGVWERKVRKMQGEFAYAVFPDSTAKLYDDKDVVTGKLIKLGLLRATKVIATGGGYKLCAYEVVTLGKKKLHKKDLSAATQPKSRRHRTPSTTRPATNPTTQPAIPPRRRRPRPATNRTTTAPATTRPVKAPLGWLGSGDFVEGFS
jgi:Ca2+/Na+ antiporter